jgi:hypothetical protein
MFLTSADIITKLTTVKILTTKINSNLHHYPIKIQNIVEKVNTNNYLNSRPKLDLKNTPNHQLNEFKTEIENELKRNIIDRKNMENRISTSMKKNLTYRNKIQNTRRAPSKSPIKPKTTPHKSNCSTAKSQHCPTQNSSRYLGSGTE